MRLLIVAIAVFTLTIAACGGDDAPFQKPAPSASVTARKASSPTAGPAGLRDIQQSLVSLNVGMFLNENSGWIAVGGRTSDLLFTSDAGSHWTSLYKFQTTLNDIDFVDAQTGWALSYDGVWKTTDGGSSWVKLSPQITHPTSPIEADGNPFSDAMQIDFVDTQTGWLGGLDVLYRSDDGGSHWTRQTVPCAPNPEKGFTYIGPMSFLDAGDGWMACPDATSGTDVSAPLLKTNDGGATWQALPALGFRPSAISFVDTNTGWAGSNRQLYSTADGGVSWRLVGQGSTDDLILPFPATTTELYLVYGPGALQASSDGGATWHVVYPPPLPNAVACALSGLSPSVEWTRSGDPVPGTTSNQYPYTGLVHGIVTIRNAGPDNCKLTTTRMSGKLLDSSRQIVAQDLATPIPGGVALPFVLQPSDQATTSVEWSQWCETSPPSGPLSLVLDVPDVGELTLDVLYPTGQPVEAPYCHTVFGSSQSFLRVGSFGPLSVPVNPP